MCSLVMPEYSTGISHPAYGTIRALDARWRACSGVCRNAAAAVSVMNDVAGKRVWPDLSTVLGAARHGQERRHISSLRSFLHPAPASDRTNIEDYSRQIAGI